MFETTIVLIMLGSRGSECVVIHQTNLSTYFSHMFFLPTTQKPTVVSGPQTPAKAPVPQAIRPPLSQLGPASSKVLMQASKPTPSAAATASRIKTGGSAAVTAALQVHTQKLEAASSSSASVTAAAAAAAAATTTAATPHKEKRKFEALKWVCPCMYMCVWECVLSVCLPFFKICCFPCFPFSKSCIFDPCE